MFLKDKVTIITGAGRGIGRQIAVDLAKEGCMLLICSRSKDELIKVKDEIVDLGAACDYIVADLSSLKNVSKVVEKAKASYGHIDILINNAAVLFHDDILEVTEKHWNFTMDVNLRAPFFLAQEVLKNMIPNQGGYIINILSTAAICVPSGIASYGVSKAGLIGVSQALYEVAKKHKIKVSMVYPGITDTYMSRSGDADTLPDQWMLPEDISACVLFLLKNSDRMVIKEIVAWSTGQDYI